MNKTIFITVGVFIIAATFGFFGGLKYQQSKQPAFLRQFGNGQRPNINGAAGGQRLGGNGALRFGGSVNGEIISADGDSITVKLADNSSKIVLLTDQTQINKAETAAKEALTAGEKVAVFGQENSDGSLTAQNIQLNPILRAVSGQ